MEKPPLNIAVVIPTYNRARFLRECIESALSQTLPPAGVYVVDDASSDETPQLMQQWYGEHPNVIYIRLSENRGPAYARMKGIQEANAEWIAFLDSDDVWTPDHLEKAAWIIHNHPHIRLIYAQRGHINTHGDLIIDKVVEIWSGNVMEVLLKRIIFRPSQVVVNKSIYEEVVTKLPLYYKELYFVEDYILGVLWAYYYGDKIYVSPHRTVLMRLHEGQSYHKVELLKNNLLRAVEIIFERLYLPTFYKKVTISANLYHVSYFMWRAGEWKRAWEAFLEGVRAEPKSIKIKDFWVALSRLLVPPQVRRFFRSE